MKRNGCALSHSGISSIRDENNGSRGVLQYAPILIAFILILISMPACMEEDSTQQVGGYLRTS